MKTRKNTANRTAARVLAAVLASPAASIDELAQAAQCSRRTVARSLRTAERLGLLAKRSAPARRVVAREVRL